MGNSRAPYIFFVLLMLVFNGLILFTPYLAMQQDPVSDSLYAVFAPTCHQLTSRSLCLFEDEQATLSISDCHKTSEFSGSRANTVEYEEKTGYKFPVCSRDMAIYLAMLAGLLILPFVWKMDYDDWPNKWILVAAAVPVGIDGGLQIIGFYESTNFLRIITGVIIGIVLPFYILPILNSLYLSIFGKKGKKR